MVVRAENELMARLRAGARLARDARGFKVWDPRTNSWERVSVELRDLAAVLYARQKYERAKEEAGNLDEVVREEEYSHIVSLIRQRVDLAEVEDAQEAWEKAKRRVRCILEEFLGVPQASV